MSKGFIGILIAIAVVLGGIFIFAKDDGATPSSGAQPTAHTLGLGNKKVTLIEYGDFQCPACGAFYPIVEQLKADYGDDIVFQFRNYPLTQIHPNAFAAHRAAEAADNQGRFWEMYNQLYQSQNSWSSLSSSAAVTAFESYAENLGLNMEQYRTDVSSTAVSDRINADIEEGQKIGATSTPTFVLNGQKLNQNPNDLEAFKKVIDEAIAAAAPTSELPPADL